MQATEQIVPVQSGDLVEQAEAVLLLAFADDPMTRWLFPRAVDHLRWFPRMIDGFAGNGLAAGTARLTADGSGAAVWLPPGVHVDEEAMGAVVESGIDDAIRPQVEDLFAAMESHHPTGDHWYLPLIGVEPGLRAAGRGTALMVEGLQRCDAEHLDVYLESTNPRNVPLYRRMGFEPVATLQVGTSPVMTPMLRPAR